MESRWIEFKPQALNLRQQGASIREVELRMGIPRSTLSGWFKGIELSTRHKQALRARWKRALVTARERAVLWHNEQKRQRVTAAKQYAVNLLSHVDYADLTLLEIALALLYLGEGSKRNSTTSLGNSDPLILNFFICAIRKVYGLPTKSFRCELHLRADQDPVTLRAYWSGALGLPTENFRTISIDARTEGKPTFDRYKGVCVVRCGKVEIQRRLMYIANGFCEKTTGIHKNKRSTLSSVG